MIGCSETANSKYAGIYVWNPTSSKLVEEKSDVDKNDFNKIISEIIKRNTNCVNKNTKVLDVKVTDKVAYINLSEEFNDSNTNSSTAAIYKINSIVYELCLNNPAQIDGVRFLIEGKMQEAIGPVSTDVPLSSTIDQQTNLS